jgi:hypothetical protein
MSAWIFKIGFTIIDTFFTLVSTFFTFDQVIEEMFFTWTRWWVNSIFFTDSTVSTSTFTI